MHDCNRYRQGLSCDPQGPNNGVVTNTDQTVELEGSRENAPNSSDNDPPLSCLIRDQYETKRPHANWHSQYVAGLEM